MEFNTVYNKIITDENLQETIQHGSSDYPFCFYYDNLALFDFHCIDWHWHEEFEFVYVENGSATFSVGEEEFELTKGYGIFINSKIIHRFYAKNHQLAIIPNFVLMPHLIAQTGSLLEKKYLYPLLHSSLNYLIFSPEDQGHRICLKTIREIINAQRMEQKRELTTVSLLYRLWNEMYDCIDMKILEHDSKTGSATQAKLHLMLHFIHANYQNSITLDDIAQSVSLSKSSVLNLFHKNLHTTPVSYLIHYRLRQAAKKLQYTELSIVQIAQDTGFDNAGYFCKSFRKYYQMTPGEYRKNCI